ncbi:hypothetical protein pb186bvf_005622 [Paramecium bursaria]
MSDWWSSTQGWTITFPNLGIIIKQKYNTIPVAIMALPAAIITIFSVKLAKKIGFRTLIRLICILQFLALLLAPYSEKYQQFIFLYFLVFGIGYSFIAFPVVTCIWSHFKEKEGKVTGLLFGVFGLATFCFVILITYIVNPSNERATLAIDPLKPEIKYFSYDVASNAPLAAQVVGIIAGTLSLIGGFLINHAKTEVVQIKNDIEETNPLEIVANQVVSEDEIQQMQKSPTLRQAAFSEPFLNIVICQSFLMYFVITLAINFKFYSLSKINDDYFVTFVDLIALLVSSGTNVIWGVLIDRLPFKFVFLLSYFISGLGAILLPILSYDQFLFAAVYILLMIFDKGALVIIGPGLLKLYGNQMGHQLYPFTHCGVLFAVLGSSLSTVILNKYLTFDEIFVLQGCIVIFSLIFIIRLNMTYYQ